MAVTNGLKNLATENKSTFRKLGKSKKFSVKCGSDIIFNKYCYRVSAYSNIMNENDWEH